MPGPARPMGWRSIFRFLWNLSAMPHCNDPYDFGLDFVKKRYGEIDGVKRTLTVAPYSKKNRLRQEQYLNHSPRQFLFLSPHWLKAAEVLCHVHIFICIIGHTIHQVHHEHKITGTKPAGRIESRNTILAVAGSPLRKRETASSSKAEAKLKLREKQLCGRKSETSSGKSETERPDGEKRPGGRQRGRRGRGRRDYSHLEAETEVLCLPENERTCSICGLPFEEFPDTEDSEVLEIEVGAHSRIVKRKKYIPAYRCRPPPEIVCAPPAARVLPKGIYGVSVRVETLLDKYLFMRPTNRLLEDLRTRDFDLAQGTLTDGLKAMAPLFDPVLQAIVAKNLEEKQWRADETRWYVFATIEGKIGYRWYLRPFHFRIRSGLRSRSESKRTNPQRAFRRRQRRLPQCGSLRGLKSLGQGLRHCPRLLPGPCSQRFPGHFQQLGRVDGFRRSSRNSDG